MNIFLNKKITSSFINRIIVSDQTKECSFLSMRIFGTINKTQDGTTVPISEAMNFFYAYCYWFQNIRYCRCHIITYTATNPSDVKMQICFGRNCCVFSTNNRYKVL